MKEVEDFADSRHKAWCIHCGAVLADTRTSKDHIPTKTLLREPFPANLPLIRICFDCNQSFSPDEQYLVAFLGSVLAGSTDPDRQIHPPAARILRHSSELRQQIERSRRESASADGQPSWIPEQKQITTALLKNARGHAMYEYGEPMRDEPVSVSAVPIALLAAGQRQDFETVAMTAWPEVGSRMMTRVMTGQDLDDGWIVVQPGIYRYSVSQEGLMTVRMVMFEYLAAEVRWE
jgi:hypothetical protein